MVTGGLAGSPPVPAGSANQLICPSENRPRRPIEKAARCAPVLSQLGGWTSRPTSVRNLIRDLFLRRTCGRTLPICACAFGVSGCPFSRRTRPPLRANRLTWDDDRRPGRSSGWAFRFAAHSDQRLDLPTRGFLETSYFSSAHERPLFREAGAATSRPALPHWGRSSAHLFRMPGLLPPIPSVLALPQAPAPGGTNRRLHLQSPVIPFGTRSKHRPGHAELRPLLRTAGTAIPWPFRHRRRRNAAQIPRTSGFAPPILSVLACPQFPAPDAKKGRFDLIRPLKRSPRKRVPGLLKQPAQTDRAFLSSRSFSRTKRPAG